MPNLSGLFEELQEKEQQLAAIREIVLTVREADPLPLDTTEDGTPVARELDDKRRAYTFNLRLTEREMVALSVISETTPESRHAFCIRLLRENLNLP